MNKIEQKKIETFVTKKWDCLGKDISFYFKDIEELYVCNLFL